MDQDPKRIYHQPVMTREVVELFEPIEKGVVVDATYGGGGHTAALLDALPDIEIVALDRDPAAFAQPAPDRARVFHRSFAGLADLLDELGIEAIAGALFDFGVSGHQLDEASRGFSYRATGPLDMRMGVDAVTTADEVVNSWPADELAHILGKYGEERFARRIANAIVGARPIADTQELATVVKDAIPAATRRSGGHPAKRTFQAIRIVVNDELAQIEVGLVDALDRLRAGGRCVAISYHSLEDRIVKRTFADLARGCQCPPEIPECRCGRTALVRPIRPKLVRPGAEETASNPRARSARLRAVEKVAA